MIEADEDGATIYDRGSSNGTKLKGKKLKPNIGYHLENKSSLLFGNVEALWLEGAPGSKVGDSDGEVSDNLLEEEEENRCFVQIQTYTIWSVTPLPFSSQGHPPSSLRPQLSAVAVPWQKTRPSPIKRPISLLSPSLKAAHYLDPFSATWITGGTVKASLGHETTLRYKRGKGKDVVICIVCIS